jgi:subtilisin family serine protease
MKKVLVIFVLLALLGALIPLVPAQAEGETLRYVIVFNGKKIPKKAAAQIEDAGGTLVKTLPEIGVAIATSDNPNFAQNVKHAKGVLEAGQERFLALPFTEAHEFEGDVAEPAYSIYQWDIRRVKADQAWEFSTGSHDTVVAILDTGVAWNHPDLAPNMVYADCFSTQPACSVYPDLHWHGTHVAGTVAAASGGGVVGVGPDLGLASYNVFELYVDPVEGPMVVAFDEAIWEAMLDVAEQGFDVINMSLGSYAVMNEGGSAEWVAWNRVVDYVTKQGVTIVASSGNGNENLNGPVAHIPSDVTGVTSVGATGIRPDWAYPQEGAYDVRADYSNYGASVTLAAPGGDLGPPEAGYPFPAVYYLIFSTYVIPDPVCAAAASCPVGWAWAGGTSMASPHVAGVAGLVKDVDPGLSAKQVSVILKQTAENLGDRQLFGHGMVDALSAVLKAGK